MSFRGVSLVGALALSMIASAAQAQEPAPWETGAPPDEEGQAADAQPDEAEPEPAPAPAPAAAPEEDASWDEAADGDLPPEGKIGLGYFTTSAPLGVRMWIGENLGFDAGLGMSIDSTAVDVGWGLSLEGGLLYALATFDNMIIFGRGGLGVGFGDSGDPASDVTYEIELNGMVGAEFFMTEFGFPNLSFTAGVGLSMTFLEDAAGDFGVRVASVQAPANLVASAVLGFHIYL